jgi:hypothetical protein
MNHPNYLGAHRKRWALSKQELAHLLGYAARDQVSRCEAQVSEPTLRLVLGCEVVFGIAPRAMFPDAYGRMEELVMARAALLDEGLRGREDAVALRQRQLLQEMVLRAERSFSV